MHRLKVHRDGSSTPWSCCNLESASEPRKNNDRMTEAGISRTVNYKFAADMYCLIPVIFGLRQTCESVMQDMTKARRVKIPESQYTDLGDGLKCDILVSFTAVWKDG